MKVWSLRAYFAVASATSDQRHGGQRGQLQPLARPGRGDGDERREHRAGDRPAEVGLPGDAGDDEAEHGVDGEHARDAGRGPPEVPVEHQQRAEQAEHRPRGADRADDPRAALLQVGDAAGRGGSSR